MPDNPFLFDIYRLNIVDEESLTFDFMGRRIRNDSDIIKVLQRVSQPDIDTEAVSGRSTFRWGIREFRNFTNNVNGEADVCGITLGRSILAQAGQTVTSDRIEDALTTLSPPAADLVHLFFYMARHLVAIEHNSAVTNTQVWRTTIHSMFDRAAMALELKAGLRLEPVPRDEEIMRAFRSFDRLTRLRVKLRIPNPELDRRTERLRREMVAGAIREYTHEMKNPNGLSTNEDNLPHAAAAMAQAGYKNGEVTMSGIRGGRRTTVRTGSRAARGRVEGLRDFVRGLGANTRTAEGKNIVTKILQEVDNIVEPPSPGVVDEQDLI